MPERCTCGAYLPPDARFCHKCGKPQYDYPGIEPEPEVVEPPLQLAPTPPAVQPIGFRNSTAVRITLVTALIAFPLSTLPAPPVLRLLLILVGFAGAGFFAVYTYSRRTASPLSLGGATRIGWMTGVWLYAFVVISAALLAAAIIGSPEARQQLMNDPWFGSAMRMITGPAELVAIIIFDAIFMFVVVTLLPIAGGALCVKFLHKD